jgi:uncharacterized damage-inducible protein DinB
MLEHFRRLFSFDDWANREIVGAVEKSDSPPERSLSFLAHIFAAERLWLERLKQVPQSVAVWPEPSLASFKREAAELPQLWNEYLKGRQDRGLEEKIRYKNSKGEAFDSRIEDILMHVIMHSVYHRGQIAADMRQAGYAPAYTDFIHGVRQGFVE